MVDIKIETEQRKAIEDIQRRFKGQLSNTVILRSTAQAINGTMKRSILKINKGVKEEYNITPKYLKHIADVKPKAIANSLYAGIRLKYAPIPIMAFKPKQTKTGVDVAIRKGKRKNIRSAFIQTMPSGHIGVYARGRYERGQGFVPHDERNITELKTASPFTAGLNEKVASKVVDFMSGEVLRTTHGILSKKVSGLTNI